MRETGTIGRAIAAVTTGVLLAALVPAAAPAAFDPAYEARNFSKIQERYRYESGTPEYRALLVEKGLESEAEIVAIKAKDPERDFSGNLCAHHGDGCAGDVRFYDWERDGHGLRIPVLFTARDGATISGHVWATRAGPSLRPAAVITPGSVQAPEELYGFAATTLAKKGYVVLTYDVQGQGRSDTYGEGADRNHNVPAQAPGGFVEGTEDGLDFLLSSPARPYRPRFPAPGIAADHAPKQERRVREGHNAAHNPLSMLVDPGRVGLAGHSLGAFAVSKVGSADARVRALVAWDNLSAGGGSMFGQTVDPITPRVPALGMAADYGLTPQPNTAEPDPQAKNAASHRYSETGVDSAEVSIRGGTHYEWSYIPNPGFGATLRGMDMAAWYTGAWLDRYVKGDASAERRLLTDRWLADARGAQIDPDGDGNLFSRYYRSRLDVGFGGGRRVTCEDLRAGTEGCTALAPDGEPPGYSYLDEALTADSGADPRAVSNARPGAGGASMQRIVLRAPRLASDVSGLPRFSVVPAPVGGKPALIDRYHLQVQPLPGSRWLTVSTLLGAAGQRFSMVYGRAYRFRARALVRGNRAGPWAYAGTVSPLDDIRGLGHPRFSRGWYRVTTLVAYGHSYTRSYRRGDSAVAVIRGSRFYLIGRRGPLGGRMLVSVGGRRYSVSTFSPRRLERQVLLTRALPAGRVNRLAILNTSLRAPRNRIEIDALGVVP